MNAGAECHGGCLCGAVQVVAKTKGNDVGACHCVMCRRWGGGPLLAVECGGDVKFIGESSIGVFDSSEWAERGFCRVCGTHLFYRLKKEGHYAIPVGLFDSSEPWMLTGQVFIDQKPAFYSFAQSTEDLTAEEVFEQYFRK